MYVRGALFNFAICFETKQYCKAKKNQSKSSWLHILLGLTQQSQG